MDLVILESPFAGDVERNIKYARMCMRDCLLRGEAPYASHLLYTQPGVLDDEIPEERKLGIEAGFFWGENADKTVVYTDLGISKGMQQGIDIAKLRGRPVEMRTLPGYITEQEDFGIHVVDRAWKDLTPERFDELVKEGQELAKDFDEKSASMRQFTEEELAKKCR